MRRARPSAHESGGGDAEPREHDRLHPPRTGMRGSPAPPRVQDDASTSAPCAPRRCRRPSPPSSAARLPLTAHSPRPSVRRHPPSADRIVHHPPIESSSSAVRRPNHPPSAIGSSSIRDRIIRDPRSNHPPSADPMIRHPRSNHPRSLRLADASTERARPPRGEAGGGREVHLPNAVRGGCRPARRLRAAAAPRW